MEEGPVILPTQSADLISRPTSTSTSASGTLPQLPDIEALAASNAAPQSPQLRATAAPQVPMRTGISPAATSGGGGGQLPTCQNCTTSTTPLWRRDEFGSVLCNACGLFLKLHGRPRPISLKTDVIKSRNRAKSMRPDLAPKKKQRQQQQQAQNYSALADANCAETAAQNVVDAAQAVQRAAQKTTNGHSVGSDSPLARIGTPSIYNHGLSAFMVDDPYQTGFGVSAGPDGSTESPMNGDRGLDPPQTHEQLIAHNSSLKTRVSELEVINELFRGRLSQLEQQEAAARRGQEVAGVEQTQLRSQLATYAENETQLRAQLEDSHRRENNLKRRLDELEMEIKYAQESQETADCRLAKRSRMDHDARTVTQELEPEPECRSELECKSESFAEPLAEPLPESRAEPMPEPESVMEPLSGPIVEPTLKAEHETHPESASTQDLADSHDKEIERNLDQELNQGQTPKQEDEHAQYSMHADREERGQETESASDLVSKLESEQTAASALATLTASETG